MRGPKPKTSRNSSPKTPRVASPGRIKPTSPLNDNALAEFKRLVKELDNRRLLERVDIGVVTACARAKDFADRQAESAVEISDITQADNLYLRWLKALALTTAPNRSVIRVDAKTQETAEAISGKIKLHA